VPVNKVRQFQEDYLTVLEANHSQILERLRKGEYTDEITGVLEKVALEVAAKFA
jgi:F-type H+-transporting ATPase subunit alpha